jgi:puromycin-sensitive aminopeptidase
MEKLWMSTYLVAMVVGEFDIISGLTKEGVVANVYTAPDQSARGRFALQVATKALSFVTASFGIPYPLKKLDMVAIPDFLGAMENWGLVTYTESYLLVEEKLSSHETKADAARAICHELSHQWFDNLVTMAWWTGLWLHESFAQFMEFDAAHHIFPEWRLRETFVQDVMLGSAFVKDAMVSSHPIEVVVNHPDEADEIFDLVPQGVEHGAHAVGVSQSSRRVLPRRARLPGPVQLQEHGDRGLVGGAGAGVGPEAQGHGRHLDQAGELPSCDGEPGRGGLFAQKRFFADTSLGSGDNTLWDVFLNFCTSDDPSAIKRLVTWDAKTASFKSSKAPTTPLAAGDAINRQIHVPAGPKGWIKLNPNQAGFYLVNYSPALGKRFETPVKEQLFGALDRVSFLNSVFTFARAGVLDLPVALDFTCAYVDESASLCWKEISRDMGYYSSQFREEPFYRDSSATLARCLRT